MAIYRSNSTALNSSCSMALIPWPPTNMCEGLNAVMQKDCIDPGSVLEGFPDCLVLACYAKWDKF